MIRESCFSISVLLKKCLYSSYLVDRVPQDHPVICGHYMQMMQFCDLLCRRTIKLTIDLSYISTMSTDTQALPHMTNTSARKLCVATGNGTSVDPSLVSSQPLGKHL